MGPAVPVIYKGRVVDLCCPNCLVEFASDPDRYLAVAMADTAAGK
jgi:YHS domain-containing protein